MLALGFEIGSTKFTFKQKLIKHYSRPIKGQLEHSGLLLSGTQIYEQSCFIVPTFDTKVTEYLCSGGFFFFIQTNFDFLTNHF